ncbi:hypothetical protein [Micrococcus cohnii]|uniref:Uncharacterized protein n=1 Tax=Micrococcus cohnii TaxID=993416 RepID=A0A7W7GM28_9MICC|nr:hypothetical protein [Micrococcus cohnii]MBB4734623.1 hypothetical protein [Micrococcus cohnii]
MTDAHRATSSPPVDSRRLRDRHGRGMRHPLPRGVRARRGRAPAIVRAVREAVDRLGALGRPELTGTAVQVQRIPDAPDALVARLRAGDRPERPELWAQARIVDARLVVTVHERALRGFDAPVDLVGTVYAALLLACADALGVDPEDLDPAWVDG